MLNGIVSVNQKKNEPYVRCGFVGSEGEVWFSREEYIAKREKLRQSYRRHMTREEYEAQMERVMGRPLRRIGEPDRA